MKIYNRLISSPYPTVEELIYLDDTLISGWVKSLPHYYRDDDSVMMDPAYSQGHAIVRWRLRNLRIIMFRPFLIRWSIKLSLDESQRFETFSPAETLAIDRCFKAAKESINSIVAYWRSCTHTRLAAWYIL